MSKDDEVAGIANCNDKIRNGKINLSSIKNLPSFQVNKEACLKTAKNSFLHAHRVPVPTHSLSFNNILPSYNFIVLRADQDVTFSHSSSLKSISRITQRLQLLKQDFDGLSYVKSTLKLTMHLKIIEKTVGLLNLSLRDIYPGENESIDKSVYGFLNLSSFLKSGLSDCSSSIKEALTLLKEIGLSCTNELHHEKIIKNFLEFDCAYFKLSYCKSLAKQIRTLVERILCLQTCLDLPADNPAESPFVPSLIFHCDVLLTSLQNFSFLIRDKFHKGKSKTLHVCHGFLFVDLWCLSADFKVTEDCNITTYIKEVAEQRSFMTAKRICQLLPSILVHKMKIVESTPEEKTESIQLNTELKNNKTLHLKSKDVAKLLRQCYCNLISEEKKYFSELLKGILEINSDKSFTNNHLVKFNYRKPTRVIYWASDMGPALNDFIYEFYTECLWNSVNFYMRNCYIISFVDCSEDQSHLNNLYLCKTKSDVLWTCMNKLIEDDIPDGSMEALSRLLLSITTFHNLQQWDYGFCKAMGAMLKDKFRYTNENPGIPSSHMINVLLRTQMKQMNIQSYFKFMYQKDILNYNNNDYSFSSFNNTIFLCQKIFLSYLTFCLCLKRQQYLIAGCWDQYFVVTSVDMRITLYFIDHLINDMQDYLASKSKLLTIVVSYLSNECEFFKTFEKRSLKVFLKAIIYRSRGGFEKHMPKGKVWRRKGHSVQSQEVNKYVNVITNMIFPPLLDNLNCLSKQKRNEIVQICIKLFIKTWMEVILDNQIMFSWFGANQLKLDFEHFLQWFEQDHASYTAEELRDLQPEAALKDMRNAILLLLCQPQGRKNSLISASNIGHSRMSTSSSSTVSEVSVDMFSGNQFDQVIVDVDLHDKDRWLALRVKTSLSNKFLCLH